MSKKLKVPVEQFDRVCGYFRPSFSANPGKREEMRERKRTSIEQIKEYIK